MIILLKEVLYYLFSQFQIPILVWMGYEIAFHIRKGITFLFIISLCIGLWIYQGLRHIEKVLLRLIFNEQALKVLQDQH
jgi:hypothetical protein